MIPMPLTTEQLKMLPERFALMYEQASNVPSEWNILVAARDLIAIIEQLAAVAKKPKVRNREELRIVVRLMLDQIEGDLRATQFFDSRIIDRAKLALTSPPSPTPPRPSETPAP